MEKFIEIQSDLDMMQGADKKGLCYNCGKCVEKRIKGLCSECISKNRISKNKWYNSKID